MTILLKGVKWCVLLAVTSFILVGLFVWMLASGSDKTVVYKQDNFLSYHILTDSEIQNAPRITENFYFESHPGDGYAPSNSIIFAGASGTASLRCYLETLGYTRQQRNLGGKEIWSKPDQLNSNLFYIYFNAVTAEAGLTKVLNN